MNSTPFTFVCRCCGCVFAVMVCFNPMVQSEVTALFGTIIDGTGKGPVLDGVVVTSGERIVSVGCIDEIAIPTEATEIRIPGATILPGFINTHVHRSYTEEALVGWAASGITTVRDLGANATWDWVRLRNELMENPANATLLISGPILTVPDGYPSTHPLLPALPVATPEEARDATRELVAEGVDVIKIAIESTVDGRRHPDMNVMSLDIASAICDAAHELGVRVTAHVTKNVDLLVAIEAGVDEIAHIVTDLVRLSTMETMVNNGVLWITTLKMAGPGGTPKLKHFQALGGTVVLGTDDGAMVRVDTDMPIGEFERMLNSGLAPMDVIVASTRNAALACGTLEEMGTLEAGKRADILVVSGNPLEDITVLGDAQFVMHRGVIVTDRRDI